MKILSLILVTILISSCAPNWIEKEIKKTGQANSSSSRINSSANNSSDIFKELDE